MLEVRATSLPDILEIRPRRHGDDRGFFSEVWNKTTFAEAGIVLDFVQDNHSLSGSAGVLRGLHYQLPPFDQSKLLRVSRGRIFDVAVDIRRSSPTFRRWVGVELSAAEWNQLLIPPGFAHGFLTLEPDTEVQYKVSAPYSPAHDRAVRWDDPAIGIDWPLPVEAPILSERDRQAPLLHEAELFS
jgi:dTDP-4-dehydrorhamnose 3,5-epimerase